MKKNKSEIIFIISILLVGFLSFYFYKQSKNLVTMDEIGYVERGGVSYKVYLNDKKYYNKEYLDEGMQYISSIIDYIDFNFQYNNVFDQKRSFKIHRKVLANVKIVDRENNDKVIYDKKETIFDETSNKDNIDIIDNIKLDYQKYNAMTNEFKTSYGISASCNLYLDYEIEYVSSDKKVNQKQKMSVTVPLSQQMINIKKSNNLYQQSSIVGETKEAPINTILFILSIICFAITAVMVALLARLLHRKIANESKYDRYIAKLLRENDSYITIAKEEYVDKDKKTIKIDSFKELMDVRNNIERPIIYTKIDNNTSKFIIVDSEIYEYKVTRKELDV